MSDRGKAFLPLGSFPPTALWRSALRSPRFWWRLIHGRWWIIRRKIPYRFLLRIIKLSISIVDLDRVLNQFAMSLWRTFGEFTFWSFVVYIFFVVEEIEVLTEVVAVWEELDVLWCFYICFFWFTSKSSWFFGVLNPGKHCLSFNWIENTLSDTGIRFLCRWIIRCRDESARLRVFPMIGYFLDHIV